MATGSGQDTKEVGVGDRFVLYKLTPEPERVIGGDVLAIVTGGTPEMMLAVAANGPRIDTALVIGNTEPDVKRAAHQKVGWVTSTVTEIVSSSESSIVFRTLNSVYELRVGRVH